MQFGQYPSPAFTIAHLSDVHFLAGGVRQYGRIDTAAGFEQVIDRLSRLPIQPDALVFTGDLADKAEPEAYAQLRGRVEPIAAEIGAQVVWVMGNHDERAPYAQGLFDSDDDGTQDRVYDVRGLRIIALDTSVPGYHHGDLTPDQLAWLTDQLATPAEHGTLLAMHHPPVPAPMLPAADLIELKDQPRLAEAIAGSDIRQILAGHVHFSTYSTFAGFPVSVASASCYTSDPAPLDRFVSGVDGGQAFTMSHLYADRVVNTVVPLAESVEVTGYPANVLELVAHLSVEELHEQVSRKDSDFNAVNEDHSTRG